MTTKRDPANALTLMDSLQPDEVAVLTANGSSNGTLWAEMMSIAAQKLEVAGVVVDGLLRDVKEIEDLQFPVFGRGARPLTVKGRMRLVAHNVPVDCGGVLVRPGDVVFGDLDGIVVVPKENLDDVVSLAVSLRDKENDTREKLLSGISMGKL